MVTRSYDVRNVNRRKPFQYHEIGRLDKDCKIKRNNSINFWTFIGGEKFLAELPTKKPKLEKEHQRINKS